MRREKMRPGDGGFSLLELMVALLLLQVGLLAVAGLVLTGQQILTRSDAVLRGTLEARLVGDSLLGSEGWSEGEREEAWGWLRWEVVGEGSRGVRILTMNSERDDTLVLLRMWPLPGDGAGIDSLPSGPP